MSPHRQRATFELPAAPPMRERFEAQPFDALIAVMALLAGVGYLASPEPGNELVAEAYAAVSWLGIVFAVLLVAAGGLLLAGIARLRKDWRLAGLAFLAGAVVLQGGAIVTVADLGRAAVTLALYVAVIAACVVRIRTLLGGRDVRVVDTASLPPLPPPSSSSSR